MIKLLTVPVPEHEFEKEWSNNGGTHYTRPADRKKNGRA